MNRNINNVLEQDDYYIVFLSVTVLAFCIFFIGAGFLIKKLYKVLDRF